MSRPRVAVVATAFVAVLLVVASGCLGDDPAEGSPPGSGPSGDDSQPRHEVYVFDHAGVDRPAIEGGIAYPREFAPVRKHYATLVTSRREADRFEPSVLDDGAEAFVANTAFDEASLVVIQAYPASSVPDYRVERVERTDGGLRISVNDSSRGGTADITVETVLVRVRHEGKGPPDDVAVTTEDGGSFRAGDGIVTRTPESTPTPETVALPYASGDPSGDVDDPRGVRIENRGTDVNGYRIEVAYRETPACREITPPCGRPAMRVAVMERVGKLPPGAAETFADVAARKGRYAVTVEASVPAADGSRRTIRRSFAWRVDERNGDAVVRITDDGVSIRVQDPDGTTPERSPSR